MPSLPQEIPGYDLIRELGVGGMATVYLALQHSLDRQVAIKVMRRDSVGADISDFERRFLLEGRTMAKLPHRNIIAVYDIVTRPEIAYIAMEYLSDGTLSERMRHGLQTSEAIAIVVQLANALDFAHRQGVVHRDLKPANVLFRDESTPVLTDFGIAKHSAATTRMTLTGMVLGTPTYMSPEQANGQQVDGRTDQYSLGILFYEMLTGNVPFTDATPMAVLMAHALKPPPPLKPELAMFQPVFDRMLAKKPEERYSTLRQFVDALRSLVLSNETLAMRLRAGSTRSSSSQLRRLGFSGESVGSSRRATLDLHQRDTGTGWLARLDPTTRMAGLRTRRGLAVLAIAIGALVLGGALWIFYTPGGTSVRDADVIRLELQEAQKLVDGGVQLVTPPDENAFKYLQLVLQRDADNPVALKLLATLATKLRDQAAQALGKGDFAAAGDLVNQALLVKPADAASAQLAARITRQRDQGERAARIADLLDKAAAAPSRPGPQADAVFGLLASARAIDPENATVRLRIAQLTKAEFDRVRAQLRGGQAGEASSMIEALRPDFGADPAFDPLALAVEDAIDMEARAQKASALLTRARAAMDADHLDEPDKGNAFDLFEQARELDPRLPAVAAFAEELVQRVVADAASAQKRNDFERALTLAEVALRIDPDRAAARDLLTAAQEKLGARRSAIAARLNVARQSLAGNLLPPGKDNAKDVLEALLKDDPDNRQARSLLESLPAAVVALAGADLQHGKLDDASALVAAAIPLYAGNADLRRLAGEIDTARGKLEAAATAREREQRIAELIGQRPISAKDAALIAGELAAASRQSQNTTAIEKRLTDALADDVRDAADIETLDAALAATQAVTATLGTRPELASIESEAGRRKTILQQQRDAEAEAQKGELVINALPWGVVDKVLDGDRKPVALPGDRNTPLRLKLPAGSYYVTLTHPGVAKSVSVFARVKPQQPTRTVASFPTLTADAYLRHAGL